MDTALPTIDSSQKQSNNAYQNCCPEKFVDSLMGYRTYPIINDFLDKYGLENKSKKKKG